MDYVYSLHKLTFSPASSPLVILDHGQWIDRELAWQLQKACEVVDLAETKTAFIRDANSSVFTATVKTYTTETLDLDARVAAMHSLIAVSALSKAPLRMELQGHTGHYWQFSSCFIKGHTPVRVLESKVARWERQWDIVATGPSYV